MFINNRDNIVALKVVISWINKVIGQIDASHDTSYEPQKTVHRAGK